MDKEKEELKKELALAFNHEVFAEKVRKGLIDDSDFYKALEENERRGLRTLKKSITFVVR